MRWAQLTDTGLIRAMNEDSLCVSPQTGLFAVADGMGGHRAGEVASDMALRLLERELTKKLSSGEKPENALVESVQEANRAVFELSGRNSDYTGMGTTVTACLKREDEIFLAQVGDSRAYLLRDGGILQLTEDHSLVQELVKSGGITEEQAFTHPQRNVLTRALGTEQSVVVDLYRIQIRAGDLLLLCTDGLTEYLRPEEMLEIITGHSKALDEAAQNLLAKALQSGGADNITMVLVEF